MADLDDVKEKIKERLRIEDLIGAHTRLGKKGNRYWGLCPFHSEKTPSFTVNPEEGFFYCFGCQKHGNIFNFIMEIEKVDFREALRLLADKAGVELAPQSEQQREESREKDALLELYRRVCGSFQHILIARPEGEVAYSYLERRGISRQTIDRFQLGLAPSDGTWLHGFLQTKGYSAAVLARSGLFSSNNPDWCLFTGRLMFPIQDRSGRVIAFGGRSLSDSGPKYINSPETPLFRKSEHLYGLHQAIETLKASGAAILVEGYFDVLAMSQAGFGNTVAPLGTAFTEKQATILRRFVDNLILCLDSDEAGMTAAVRAAMTGEKSNLPCRAVVVDGAKDPAEILEKAGVPALQKILDYPITIVEFLLKTALDRFRGKGPEGKQLVTWAVFPYISSLGSSVKREASIDQVADALGVSREGVWRDFSSFYSPAAAPKNLVASGNRVSSELYLLLAVTANREYFSDVRRELSLEDFEDPLARELYILLEESFRRGDSSIDDLLTRIENDELENRVREATVSEEYSVNPKKLVRDAANEVRAQSLRRGLADIIRDLKRAENEGDPRKIKDALERKMCFDAELRKLREYRDA